MLDKEKVDLNKPAFGPGAQSLAELLDDASKTKETSEEETKQEVKEDTVVKDEEKEESVEETKVPYSRFKNVNQARRDAEAEADKWRARATELEESRATRRTDTEEIDGEMPSYWKELYGDSEASEKAWKIQQRREQEIEQRAYDAGQRGAQELKQVETARVNENLSVIDSNFEDLSTFVGRDLTEKEQSAILDIVDDYTAKDEDGNYLGAVMPFEKAWEVYELKNSKSKVATRQSRDTVAALTGANTQGEPSAQVEKDKNWNPLDWNAWKKRV